MIRRALVATMVLGVLAACGSDGSEQATAPPAVDNELAPASVGDDLDLHESTAKETVRAFANVGERSLVSDGRLWEIRRADRLVGALQLTAVRPTIDLTREATRTAIVSQILPGSSNRIRIGDEEVYTTTVNDKAVFVWFARRIYVVLQLKDRELDGRYDVIAEDILAHQVASDAWDPLPIVVDTDDS